MGPSNQDGVPSWLATVRALVRTVDASDALDVEISVPGLRVRMRRSAAAQSDAQRDGARASERSVLSDNGLHKLASPLTGVWYEAASPGAAPFVAIGDPVEVGTIVGLVETMKIFNEVASDVRGVVRDFLVSSGELVAANTPLLAIELHTDSQLQTAS